MVYLLLRRTVHSFQGQSFHLFSQEKQQNSFIKPFQSHNIKMLNSKLSSPPAIN